MRNQSRVDAPLYQEFRHAAIQVVKAFNQSGFDGPLALEPFRELVEAFKARLLF